MPGIISTNSSDDINDYSYLPKEILGRKIEVSKDQQRISIIFDDISISFSGIHKDILIKLLEKPTYQYLPAEISGDLNIEKR